MFWEILRVHLLLICVFKRTKLQMFWEMFESSFSVDLVVLNWTRLQMFGKTQEFIHVGLVLNQTGLPKMFWEILGLLEVLQSKKNSFHNDIEGSLNSSFVEIGTEDCFQNQEPDNTTSQDLSLISVV
jgi:hypothetical protein